MDATTTKATKPQAKKTTTAKPAPKPKLDPTKCKYGEGAYGSPVTMKRCGAAKEHAGRQLCDRHEALWRVEAKRRDAAKRGLPAPVAKSSKVVAIHANKPKAEKIAAFLAPTPAPAND